MATKDAAVEAILGRLDLEQYVDAFAQNDIDIDTLGQLTDEDLRALGVSSLGHRKKLLLELAGPGSTPASAAPVGMFDSQRWHGEPEASQSVETDEERWERLASDSTETGWEAASERAGGGGGLALVVGVLMLVAGIIGYFLKQPICEAITGKSWFSLWNWDNPIIYIEPAASVILAVIGFLCVIYGVVKQR